MKKGVFSLMNYVLPKMGILSLHSGCNEGKDGDVTLFFGLSGEWVDAWIRGWVCGRHVGVQQCVAVGAAGKGKDGQPLLRTVGWVLLAKALPAVYVFLTCV